MEKKRKLQWKVLDMSGDFCEVVKRLTPLLHYHSSNLFGDSLTTGRFDVINEGETTDSENPQFESAGRLSIKRRLSWRREVVEGTIFLMGRPVRIEGDNHLWVLSSRTWGVCGDMEGIKGRVQFPACWRWFSVGPYARIFICEAGKDIEFEVSGPYSGGGIYYRCSLLKTWQKMFVFPQGQIKSAMRRMFPDDGIFAFLTGDQAIVFTAALPSLSVFSGYLSE